MRIIGMGALWLLLAAAPAAAGETKPDFSGTWIFNPAKSRLEHDAPTKMIWVIEHRDPRIRITGTRTWPWGEEESDPSRPDGFGFSDGRESYEKDGEFESWTRLTWMGGELVRASKVVHRGEEGTNVVHYRLADGAETFVAAEWTHLPNWVHHNLWVFDREPEE